MTTTPLSTASRGTVDIRFGPLFPWAFHFMAAIGILLAIAVFSVHPWIALIIAAGCAFVFSGFEGTEINLDKKQFREYTTVFFVKTGEWIPFETIEKIYVNKNKMKQTLRPSRTAFATEISFSEFSVFLKFSDEEIVKLRKNKFKKKVMTRAKQWADQLEAPLYDNTGEAS